ncbi:peptidoglycan-associated lipoprotein Pal [Salicola sp. Rm-C-2C1-2]|uniref:peptidoglycan-associated lipoprotein Pal n=1 Tax=Salicola sp. Rm-C-2C1-2 TaxID=3141321 RepID=UPI0032E3CBB2
MTDLLKNRVLILGFALLFVAGCSSTATEPEGSGSDGMSDADTEQQSDSDSGSSDAYGAGDDSGVSEEAMTEAERAQKSMQQAKEKAMKAASTIYFDFDSAEIQRASRSILEAHAAYLAEDGNASVVLEGHTDERGSREYNMALGERRAESVARFLRVNDVSADQIETVSYGEEQPAVDESNEEAWAENRRVEINYE